MSKLLPLRNSDIMMANPKLPQPGFDMTEIPTKFDETPRDAENNVSNGKFHRKQPGGEDHGFESSTKRNFLPLPDFPSSMNRAHSLSSQKIILQEMEAADDGEDLYPQSIHRSAAGNLSHKRSPSVESLINVIGLKDICGNDRLWKMLMAEFIGTLFLVFIGCGSCISGWSATYAPSMVQISLAFGITAATIAQAIGHVSGCHVNPSITIGLIAFGKCSLLKGIAYIIAQCLGGISGAAILMALTPAELQGNLGMTLVSPKLDPIQGFFVEALITFVLVLTVCGVCDDLRNDIKGSAPLAIGLSISVCHLMAIQYTGSSMNPARTLGPAVITKIWENHWVYWAGPLLGGFAAGFLYKLGFSEVDKDATKL